MRGRGSQPHAATRTCGAQTIRWSMIDDEEFAWRVAEQYGPSGVVKMRYLIGKFDVGEMAGGLQGTSTCASVA